MLSSRVEPELNLATVRNICYFNYSWQPSITKSWGWVVKCYWSKKHCNWL